MTELDRRVVEARQAADEPSRDGPTVDREGGVYRLDHALSPRTGLTRAHWESAADVLIDGAWQHANADGSLLRLPGSPGAAGVASDGLEGFARCFLLAALRIRGAGGAGMEARLAGLARGLEVGSRPGPSAWPIVGDRSQALVESGSIALALLLTRRWLWDRLDPTVQGQLRQWLRPALTARPVENNWWLFSMVVASFLQEVGDPATPSATLTAVIDASAARVEQWYQQDGWYSDGPARAFDHYNSWGFHFYPLLVAQLRGDDGAAAVHGERLGRFLEQYTKLFDADGAPLYFGRSLTYRFGATASVWLGALTGNTPLSPGATRRIGSGALAHFLSRGAVHDGVLGLGWYRGGDGSTQAYSGPASPYWAAKAFVGLLAPAGHPVWSDVEAPAPAEVADAAEPLGATGLLLHSTHADGLVRVHNHGVHLHLPGTRPQVRDDALYAGLDYSTRTSPVLSPTTASGSFHLLVRGKLTERGPISHVADGPGWSSSVHRPLRARGLDRHLVRLHLLATRVPQVRNVRVDSLTLARGAWEVTVHRVCGAKPGTPVRHGGWPVGSDDPAELVASTESPHRVVVGTRALQSCLHLLLGFDDVTVDRGQAQTPHGRHSAVPVARGVVSPPRTGRGGADGGRFATASCLSADPGRVDERLIALREEPARLGVDWGDGTPIVWIDTSADAGLRVSVS
jgi:hypothetical protein